MSIDVGEADSASALLRSHEPQDTRHMVAVRPPVGVVQTRGERSDDPHRSGRFL